MPEQITKYPEVTLRVLKGAGAHCGEGVKQRILTKCPADRFCALPTGEICVYGIDQIPQMTQITLRELGQVVCPPKQQPAAASSAVSKADVALLGATLAVGLMVGMLWGNFKGR